MQIDVFDLSGKAVDKMELPVIFSEPLREDLILRAVLSSQSKRRQAYGTDPMAGMRSSAHYHGYRRHRWSMMNREMARLPRLHGKLSPHLMWSVRTVPQAVGGRAAHPPKIEKVWEQKVNDKERKKAVRSAIAATSKRELVLRRGHRVEDVKSLPIVVKDDIEKVSSTKELVEFLSKVGLGKELERTSQRKVRAGRGKSRNRKYKTKTGPLFVVTDGKKLGRAAKNVLGCDVCKVENLSAEVLAPGAAPGRLVIWTKSALEKLA